MPTLTAPLDLLHDRLSELADRAAAGEEVVLTRDGRPVAKIVAADPAADPAAEPPPNLEPRKAGSAEGMIYIADDFDDPIDDFAEYM